MYVGTHVAKHNFIMVTTQETEHQNGKSMAYRQLETADMNPKHLRNIILLLFLE